MKKTLASLLAITTLSTAFANTPRDFHGMTAEEAKDTIQTLNVFDSIVTYPYPSWFSNGVVGDISKQKTDTIFIYDQVPNNQTVENWQELYSVYGINNHSPKSHLGEVVDSTFLPFAKYCGKDNMNVVSLRMQDNDEFYLLFCGGYDNPKEKAKIYGEVALFRFMKNDHDYIRLAQEWKVKPFDINDPEAIKGLKTRTIDTAIDSILNHTFVSDKIAMK